MTAVGDARKRRQESVPADETVRVPAALVAALREALGKSFAEMDPGTLRRMYGDVGSAAYALVDAAERPDEDNHGGRGWEATETGWRCTECHHKVIGPVDVHIDAAHRCCPAPLSSPRRTRDEGSGDEAEAAATCRRGRQTMTIQARYSGECPECGEWWQPGDFIRADEDRAWKHAVCPDDVTTKVVHPVCQSCRLSHPEGECDR